MEFVLYIEIGLALLTVAMVLWVVRLAKRAKAASLKSNNGEHGDS